MSVTWQGPLHLPPGHLGIVGNEAGLRIAVKVDEHGRIAFAADGDEIAVPRDVARALALIVVAATGDADDLADDLQSAAAGLANGGPS